MHSKTGENIFMPLKTILKKSNRIFCHIQHANTLNSYFSYISLIAFLVLIFSTIFFQFVFPQIWFLPAKIVVYNKVDVYFFMLILFVMKKLLQYLNIFFTNISTT